MIKSRPKITIKISASDFLKNNEIFIAWRYYDYAREHYKTYREDGPATAAFMYDRGAYTHGYYTKLSRAINEED